MTSALVSRAWLLTLLACLLAGCTRTVTLTVVNAAAVPLSQVVVQGQGFSISLGSIAPGATQKTSMLSNQGPFTLVFEAEGKRHSQDSTNQPWDGFKEIIMTVAPNLSLQSVSVTRF